MPTINILRPYCQYRPCYTAHIILEINLQVCSYISDCVRLIVCLKLMKVEIYASLNDGDTYVLRNASLFERHRVYLDKPKYIFVCSL